MSDRIEKPVEIEASVSRVWRALTDYREFGEWFSREARWPICSRPSLARIDDLSRL